MIEVNEYDFDSSDEEDVQNTIGNIPIEWYDNCSHMGYDISGRPLMKPSQAGAIDSFINNVENQNKGLVIKDPNSGQSVLLSEEDILKIKGLCSSRGYLSSSFNDDEYDTNWFTRDVMETPVTAHPPQKRSFIPSLLDKKRVARMVYAIKMGRMKMPEPEDKDSVLDADYEKIINMNTPDVYRDDYNKRIIKNVTKEYLQWLPNQLQADYQLKYQTIRQIIRPPADKEPGNDESYKPPEEYLLDDKERKQFLSRFFDPSYNPNRLIDERPLIPKSYPNLRSVPYSQAPIIDKQKRLRDILYASRCITEKVNSSTEKMLKQVNIPPNSDMKPYPNTVENNVNVKDIILSISVSYCGQYIATAGYELIQIFKTGYSATCSVLIPRSIYPVSTLSETVDKTEKTLRNPSIVWNPYNHLLAIALNNQVRIINPIFESSNNDFETRMKEWWTNSATKTDDVTEEPSTKKSKLSSQWSFDRMSGKGRSFVPFSCFVIDLEETILDMSWHSCGDYLLTICGKGKATNSGGKVQMHRLSKCASQSPFGDSNKHLWSHARFHSQKNQPLLFLAEQNSSNIQVYDMGQKKLTKTLQVTGKTSCMEMHPRENHLVVGTFEGKICWFDLDMGITPFKTLNVNHNSVRSISLHRNYPLMSCSTANGSVVVFYAKVFNTFDSDPIVMAVSLFDKLDKAGDAHAICFHPEHAKLFCGGAEKRLYEINSCH